jgi:hypothetical protein
LEHVTRVNNSGWVDCHVAFVNVPNDSFFIDQEGGTVAKALLFVKDAVILDDCAFEIAKERERDPNLLCKFAVGGNTVYAKTKNLSVTCLEFCDISLIRF